MKVEKIDNNIYEIAPEKKGKYQMNVPVHIYANDYIINKIKQDKTIDQITNVATLKGIQKHAVALSDAHQGYGFCIGGVAGTKADTGMVSPGGVGFDINCGVRLLRTNLKEKDIRDDIPRLINQLYRNVPSGLGSSGKINLSISQLDELVDNGLNWALENGYAIEEDLKHCEDNGFLEGADSALVSQKAKQRGNGQVGSLGSGNHFLEIQKVDEIYNPEIAKKLGINEENQVTVMIHTGSRAYGHQVCTDSLRMIEKAMNKYGISIPDRQLACVPADTDEAHNYLSQMACAANFGFCNRQLITHWTREVFEKFYQKDLDALDMHLIYGVCHNILKVEEHKVNGKKMDLNVHRKGATRALPPGHHLIPEDYRDIGQPALIPGTMGSASYLCVGRERAMELSFGSTAHGAGRVMSRKSADRKWPARQVQSNLSKENIFLKAASMKTIAEEAPGAYKDVNQVVQVSHDLGIVEKVAKFTPLGVLKG